ncbi:trehalose-phosphatase [Streptomyces sp. NPDC054796]
MVAVPTPRTAPGREALDAILAEPGRAVVAVDFDGTLAPIVADPEQARAHPGAVPALSRLAPRLCAVAVITGRPVEAAVRYGGFEGAAGLDHLTVLGAYGAERWDAATGTVRRPEPPVEIENLRRELPTLLEELRAPEGTWVEDKGRALAVHTRRADDPAGAFALLREPLAALAERHGLRAEPGRMVMELRPHGVDKGAALAEFVRAAGAGAVLYAGDDLGDLAAFSAVEKLRGEGVPGLLVCSGSDEVTELAERADLTVNGPAGVVDLLERLADSLR